MDIDFVVTWVDGSDPKWIQKKNLYDINVGRSEPSMNSEKAFREWDTFKYWFRGVEKFAPWVHKIYLVTDNQKPAWINENNPKLEIVDHRDFIPEKYLPVFNANSIEDNLFRIPELSEHFVFFNDDMYLTSLTSPEDFFVNGLPCDILAFSPIIPDRFGTANFQVNDTEIISTYFTKNNILKTKKIFKLKYGIKNLLRTILQMPSKSIVGFYEPHLPCSLLKNTFKEVWKKEPNILEHATETKFREKTDVNVWLFRYWQLARGEFFPRNSDKFGKLFTLSNNNEELWKIMKNQKYKVMCINDDFNISNVENVKKSFNKALKNLFPEKSSYEK